MQEIQNLLESLSKWWEMIAASFLSLLWLTRLERKCSAYEEDEKVNPAVRESSCSLKHVEMEKRDLLIREEINRRFDSLAQYIHDTDRRNEMRHKELKELILDELLDKH